LNKKNYLSKLPLLHRSKVRRTARIGRAVFSVGSFVLEMESPQLVAELVLIEESFQTVTGDYSKLMDAYAKANRVEDAERIYQKMTEKGIDADIQVLVILLQMYCDAGILDRAKEVFESLRSQGFQPDLKTYKSMIVAYVNAGLPKAAEALIREMEARDIKPTLEMYMVLLRAFAQRGLVDSAQRMFNNMQFSGIQPNLEACTLLLEAYGHAGDPDQARHSFDFMIRAGHKPDDRCVASMIAAYQMKNLLDKALDLLLNMEKDGFKPGIATYTVLVDWLGKLLLVDEVEQILDKIAELGDVPFQTNVSLCDMYSRSGDKSKAVKYLKRVEGRKELLSAEQFERVINGLIAGGFVEHAKRIHDVMQARGFSPSESVRIALMANQPQRKWYGLWPIIKSSYSGSERHQMSKQASTMRSPSFPKSAALVRWVVIPPPSPFANCIRNQNKSTKA
ncbi:hypothetical protein Taro_032279, partial [Colocasia esculenta]|nr:hypothetical protein [Colocasia esculenta]